MKRIKNKRNVKARWMYMVFLCILAHCLCGCALKEQEHTIVMESSSSQEGDTLLQETDANNASEADEVTMQNQNLETGLVYVHVCGAVKNPGVYALCNGARVVDAVMAAGGFRKKADEAALNQAELVTDGQRLYIPSEEEVLNAGSQDGLEASGSKEESLVNLNQATKEQLMTLPGIGDAKASMIIKYREEHGSFTAIEDIMNIEGIKEGVFSKIKDYITVG